MFIICTEYGRFSVSDIEAAELCPAIHDSERLEFDTHQEANLALNVIYEAGYFPFRNLEIVKIMEKPVKNISL